MHVPDELPEAHTGVDGLHVAVGRADGRCVEEHQVDAGDDEDAEQHRRDEAQAERVPQAQHRGGHLDRVQVQEEVGESLQGSATGGVARWVPEGRPPRCAPPDASAQPVTGRVGDRRFEGVSRSRLDVDGGRLANRRLRLGSGHRPPPVHGPSTGRRAGSGSRTGHNGCTGPRRGVGRSALRCRARGGRPERW